MQKKIIALAIAAALAAPALALADTANVNVYGVADVSYDMTKNGVVSANKVSSNSSRLGLKGSEDLGGGLNAIWQIESAINMDGTATTGLGGRNTFAGVASDSMGKVILGRHDTPYKIATRGMDQFADSIADNRSLMGATGGTAGVHDARATDVVAYISPAMSGMTVAVAYVANAEGVVAAGANKGSAYSLAAMYDNAGINGAFGYQTIKGGDAGTGALSTANGMVLNDKATAWKLAGGYTMDAINVNAIYEKTGFTPAAAVEVKQTNIYLSGKYSFGSDAVKLAYNLAGKVAGVAGTDAKQVSLGYDHSMSKRTTVYALYTKVSNGTGSAYGLGNQTTGAVAAAAAGQNPTAFSFGMKHTF